jgi:hypothetical protein
MDAELMPERQNMFKENLPPAKSRGPIGSWFERGVFALVRPNLQIYRPSQDSGGPKKAKKILVIYFTAGQSSRPFAARRRPEIRLLARQGFPKFDAIA